VRFGRSSVFFNQSLKGRSSILKLAFFHQRPGSEQRLIHGSWGYGFCGNGWCRFDIISRGLRSGGRSKAYS
jgi:hypothetical protein